MQYSGLDWRPAGWTSKTGVCDDDHSSSDEMGAPYGGRSVANPPAGHDIPHVDAWHTLHPLDIPSRLSHAWCAKQGNGHREDNTPEPRAQTPVKGTVDDYLPRAHRAGR
ncbi:hypothetical protein GCM10023147_19360 [Tsukamurella soli]|uniref:Uncharacterized protein n=1 Tax=Tsukamurella soli TaxID=644556 RepID=A0ABP8JI53_9ACTN